MFRSLFLVGMLIPSLLIAQPSEESVIKIDLSGYVQHAMFLDSYESTDTRDGTMLLYPNQALFDTLGNDLNENKQFQMVAIQSRPRFKITGTKLGGASVSGLIEMDFFGTSQDYIQMIRLRHAYLKIHWDKASVLIGQYWHPMFSPSCAPSTIEHGAGVPFHPLNRSPQVRFTFEPVKNLNFLISLHSAGYHKSKGPADAARNSGIPEAQFNTEYNSEIITIGATAGYKILQPRTITEQGVKTSKTIGSYNLEAYAKLNIKSFSIKVQGLLGENLTNYVMLGGYGAAQDPEVVDDYNYANLTTYSFWTDLAYTKGKLSAGLFLAQTGNLGSETEYFALSGYTRAANIKSLYRISPRLSLNFKPLRFSLEYGLTAAEYAAETDANGRITAVEDMVMNHRILLVSRFTF